MIKNTRKITSRELQKQNYGQNTQNDTLLTLIGSQCEKLHLIVRSLVINSFYVRI